MAEIEQLIKLEVDRGSQRRAIVAIEQVERAGRDIGDGFADGARRAQRALRDIEADSQRASKDRFDNIENFGERTSAIFGGFAGGSELGNIAGLVGDVGAALGTIGAPAAAATLGVGLLTLAFTEIQKAAERAAERANTYTDSLKSVNELIAGGATTADLTERRRQLETENNVFEQSASQLTNLKLQYVDAIREFYSQPLQNQLLDPLGVTRIADEFNAQLLDLSGGAIENFGALDTALEDDRKQVNANRQELILLDAALASNRTATADAAAAIESLNNATLEQARNAVTLADEYNQTSEATQRRIDGINAELNFLKESIQAYEQLGTSESDLAPLYDRYSELLDVYGRLSNDVLPKIIAQEQQRSNAQNILDTNQRLVEAEAELADLRREDADAAQSLADKLAAIQLEAQAQYDSALEDGVDRQLDIIEDAQDREAEIRKRFGRENAEAIAERDAKAAYLANQNAKDELEANDAALSKQIKREQEALDKRLKGITDNANKSILAEQRRYEKEDQQRDRAIQQALVDELNLRNGLAAITTNSAVTVRNNVTSIFGYMTQIGSAVQNYWALVAQNVAASIGSLPTTGGGGGSGDGGGGRLADPTRASTERLIRAVVDDQLNATLRAARRGA